MRVGKNAFCDFIYQPIEWENLHGQVDSGRTPSEGDHLKNNILAEICWDDQLKMDQ